MEQGIWKIAACIVTLAVGVVGPLAIPMVYGWKRRNEGVWRAWMIGAAGFFVPQLVIRPLLRIALSGTGYEDWALGNPIAYAFLSALFAAVLELAGRCAGAGLLRKTSSPHQALAAGLGHGGMESIILIGVSYVNNLAFLVMLQNGQFDAMVAEIAATGVDTEGLTAAALALESASAWLFLLAGLERVLTMICQACMTVMVFYGFHRGRPLPWLLGCLGIHFLIDCIAAINLLISTEWIAYTIIYAILAVAAGLCLALLLRIRRLWQSQDVPETPGL